MKGKEIIKHAVRAEMPDVEQLRENIIRQATKKETTKHVVLLKRYSHATACLVIVLTFVIALLHNNKVDVPETSNYTLRGLPVKNFNLADVENNGASMSRICFQNVGSILEWGVDCFAVVKVIDTQITKQELSLPWEHQISEVKLLKNVYGEFETKTVQIKQSVIRNHFCLGTTNLLRKGGVYLLPLSKSDTNWYIMGDFDVLYEVDDTGKVWSHSSFEDFNRYDGKSIEYLIEELQRMFSNDDYMLANSPFSRILRGWTLADITITSKSEEKIDNYGQHYYNYTFTVNEIFSEPMYQKLTPLGKTGIITVYTNNADVLSSLNENRYLICLDRYKGEIYVNSRMIAKIENDSSITVIPASDNKSFLGFSIFTPYNGYKLDEIREMILRIETWCEAQK